MQITEHHSGLSVAWSATDQKRVQHEISRLDRALFLDPERDPETRQLYWTVKQHLGSGHRPHRVIVWRDAYGRPKPLNMGIVEELKRRERKDDPVKLIREAAADNEARRQKLRDEADETYGAMEREHRKRIRAAELDSLPPFWRPRKFGADKPKAA